MNFHQRDSANSLAQRINNYIALKWLFLAVHHIIIFLLLLMPLSEIIHVAVVMKITECDQTKTQIEKRENRGCEAFFSFLPKKSGWHKQARVTIKLIQKVPNVAFSRRLPSQHRSLLLNSIWATRTFYAWAMKDFGDKIRDFLRLFRKKTIEH